MKKNTFFIFVIIFALFLSTSCEKQEQELIIGTWKLQSMENVENYSEQEDGETYSETYTETFNGSILSVNEDGELSNHSYSETLTINEDGTYKLEKTKDGLVFNQEDYWYLFDTDKNNSVISIEFEGWDWDYEYATISELSENNLVLTVKINYLYQEATELYRGTFTTKRTYTK